MATTTITRTLLRDLPPLPKGAAKRRIFDDRLPGFIAEQRRRCITFYLRYTDARRRRHEYQARPARRRHRRPGPQARRAAEGGGQPGRRPGGRDWPSCAPCRPSQSSPATAICRTCRNACAPPATSRAYLRLRILPAIGRKALDEVTQAGRRRSAPQADRRGPGERHGEPPPRHGARDVQPGAAVAAIHRATTRPPRRACCASSTGTAISPRRRRRRWCGRWTPIRTRPRPRRWPC